MNKFNSRILAMCIANKCSKKTSHFTSSNVNKRIYIIQIKIIAMSSETGNKKWRLKEINI